MLSLILPVARSIVMIMLSTSTMMPTNVLFDRVAFQELFCLGIQLFFFLGQICTFATTAPEMATRVRVGAEVVTIAITVATM
jgi:hypothetical protein